MFIVIIIIIILLVCMYIYIYRERERGRERGRDTYSRKGDEAGPAAARDRAPGRGDPPLWPVVEMFPVVPSSRSSAVRMLRIAKLRRVWQKVLNVPEGAPKGANTKGTFFWKVTSALTRGVRARAPRAGAQVSDARWGREGPREAIVGQL